MKKTCIVTGGTKNHFPAMAVLALNIADICPDIADELIIFHDGIPESEQKKVTSIFPTRFIEYKSPFNNCNNFSKTVSNYFTSFVFCKYECFKLLEEYECVIWTDYDVVILKDISEIKIKNKYYAKFTEGKTLASKFENKLFFNHHNELKKIPLLEKSISTPLFVLYDTFPNYLKFYDKLIKTTIHFSDSLYLPEEAILSYLFIKNSIKYQKLDFDTYVTIPETIKQNKKIMKIYHASGQPKFWNGLNFEKWNEYYNIWTKKFKGKSLSKKY